MEPAHIYCRGVISAPIKILIVGESWANRGVMANGAIKYLNRAGRPARVCSVGLSGMNTGEQIIHFKPLLTPQFRSRVLGGTTTHVVIVTGINDVTQHIGPARYTRDVTKLIDLLGSGAKVAVTELPTMDANPASHGLSYVKRTAQRYWFDAGNLNPVIQYRSALAASNPRAIIIDYDSFARSVENSPETYSTDRIHLVPIELERFGGYVASRL
jgi:hypothetical protein